MNFRLLSRVTREKLFISRDSFSAAGKTSSQDVLQWDIQFFQGENLSLFVGAESGCLTPKRQLQSSLIFLYYLVYIVLPMFILLPSWLISDAIRLNPLSLCFLIN